MQILRFGNAKALNYTTQGILVDTKFTGGGHFLPVVAVQHLQYGEFFHIFQRHAAWHLNGMDKRLYSLGLVKQSDQSLLTEHKSVFDGVFNLADISGQS